MVFKNSFLFLTFSLPFSFLSLPCCASVTMLQRSPSYIVGVPKSSHLFLPISSRFPYFFFLVVRASPCCSARLATSWACLGLSLFENIFFPFFLPCPGPYIFLTFSLYVLPFFVTMLQRSPSYIVGVPRFEPFFTLFLPFFLPLFPHLTPFLSFFFVSFFSLSLF
jgi:hypothetical protein